MAGATKAGYFGSGLLGQPLTIDAARPEIVVNMTLTRAGEVSGRVLNESTREPVAGVEISLFTKQWNYGKFQLNPAGRELAVTDADGSFRFVGLPPGEYIASARSLSAGTPKVLRDFSKADAAVVDEAYDATYWPGGGSAASAFGAALTSGGYADVGSMFVQKSPQYRALVTLQGTCAEGETVRVSVLKRDGGRAAPGSFPCANELLLRGLDPGSYALYVSEERRSGGIENTVSGAATFEVLDKNLSVRLPLQRDVIIEGQLTLAEGVTAPRVVPRIVTRPADLVSGAQTESETLVRWTPDQQHFQLAVSPRAQSLAVSEFPGGPYVKEIRYNGVPVRGSTLPINPGAASHKLEIVLDDKYGSLAGSVTDGSRTVADAQVIIMKDSARLEDLGAQPPGFAVTSASGSFPAARLAPGDYRIVAFPREQQRKIHEAGVLERLLSTAQRVTVTSGGTQTVTVRLSDVR